MSPEILTAIQGYLSNVGISATVNTPDKAKYTELTTKGWNNGGLLAFVSGSPNWTSTLARMFVATNYVSVKRSEGFKEILDLAQSASDLATQKYQTQQAVSLIAQDQMVIALMENGPDWMTANYVHDAGFGSYFNPAEWAPQNAWMDKK